jgi:hypothetical protein
MDVNFPNGEEFYSEPNYGRYHLFLSPGSYTLEVSCENYYPQTHEVTVIETSAEILEIELARYNEPPKKPSINGPENGKVGKEYEYTFITTYPNLDELEYYIKWGDGHVEVWKGPYNSGGEVKFSHIWVKEDTYTIQAKVRDIYGEESDWGFLEVTMPRSRTYNSLSHWILLNFQNTFPFLRLVFTLLK